MLHQNGEASFSVGRLWSIDMKQWFDDELSKIGANLAKNSVFLTETTYLKLINDVQKAKVTTKKELSNY